MYKLTSSLLAGSGVSAESCPLLVGLLELAAARPSVPLEGHALKRQFHRQWAVLEAVWHTLTTGKVSDADLREAMPFAGLHRNESGWVCTLPPLEVRPAVTAALGMLCVRLRGSLVPGAPVKESPCRYCGDASKLLVDGNQDAVWVKCRTCGTRGPSCDTVHEALAAWNRPVESGVGA